MSLKWIERIEYMITKLGLQLFGTAKKNIKENRTSERTIIRIVISTLYFLWNAAQTVKRVCFDSEFRSIFLLQLINSRNVHQTTPYTYMDRYPTIFSACSEYLEGKQGLKILSYGCSTGEEVLTLRKYFPNAQIVGADINKRSLAKCKKLPVDNNIKFIYSTPSEIQKHGSFDAIFCMAVLQRKPHYIKSKGISSLKKIYPFEKFEQQIIELDNHVNKDGLLVIHFTQYSLCDTEVAPRYMALGNHNQNDYLTPVFDKNSNLIKNPPPQNSIFIKI
ncbi:class I SAM-dependent methyltransferase [Bacillus sp. 1P10SD]|uniref:class I SAM-dependent methyltransferase n=1 Tax=Bacillus sp. 1P10SD TaxID=3132265 RepID=UPI0039A4363D